MAKTYFIIVCGYCINDDESGIDIIGVKEDFEKAKELYQKQLGTEKQNAENNGYDCIDESPTSFSAYEEGYYEGNHIDLYIERVEDKENTD